MNSSEEWCKQGIKYEENGDYGKAIESFFKALQLSPDDISLWSQFAQAFRYVQFSNYDGRLKEAVTRCFALPIGNHQDLANASISLLKLMPPFQFLFQTIARGDEDKIKILLKSGELFKIAADPLFISLLKKTIAADPQIEKLLAILRKECLTAFFDQWIPLETEGSTAELFIVALAIQCSKNQFIYISSNREEEMVDALENNVDWNLEELDQAGRIRIALVGCYRPLAKLAAPAGRLQEKGDFKLLLDQSLYHPLEEKKIQIPCASPIKNAISKKVQEQYETNPYPSWSNVAFPEKKTLTEYLKNSLPDIQESRFRFSDNPRILIAGCGTGQHVLNTANQIKNAHVVGLDLSRNSLAFAKRKADELQCPNLEFLQGDILEYHPKEKFDLIECVGVLHHMEDPRAGFIRLLSLLKPRGALEIGLYSELGRQDVIAAREFIKENGYGKTDREIRRCRQDLLKLSEDSLAKNVTRSIEFYSLAGCRDLLFHVQEHRFNLLQIKKLLSDLGLEFLGFSLRDKNIRKQYRHQYPEDPQGLSLDNWNEFEEKNPYIFAGMYQFWAAPKD